MPRFCKSCGRPRDPDHHPGGLCDMAELSDGRLVHVNRIDRLDGDVREEIDTGKVKVANRWIKKKGAKSG